jgi:hypothetical protein
VNRTENIAPPTTATRNGSDARIAVSTRMFQSLRSLQLAPTSGASINPVWKGSNADTGLHLAGREQEKYGTDCKKAASPNPEPDIAGSEPWKEKTAMRFWGQGLERVPSSASPAARL